jgi:osmotically-inducible protein OsmY
MIKKRHYILFFMFFSLSSCVPMIIGAGALVGGKLFVQDRTVGEYVSDSTIWTRIKAGFVTNKIDDAVGSINVEVSEGRVLLTGFVAVSQDRVRILKVVWEQDGVKEVINEMKLRDEEGNTGVFNYAKDSWTTSQIKTKLLFASGIVSSNYSVETLNSVVYLFGISHTEDELESVKSIASVASGVSEVVSYVRVKRSIDARLEATKGKKVVSNQEQVDQDPVTESEVSVDEIFDTEDF